MTLPDNIYQAARENLSFLKGLLYAKDYAELEQYAFREISNAIEVNFNVTEYELYKRIEQLENINKEQVCAISDLRHKICRLECNQDRETPKKKGWFGR